jgi:hypothetical protein
MDTTSQSQLSKYLLINNKITLRQPSKLPNYLINSELFHHAAIKTITVTQFYSLSRHLLYMNKPTLITFERIKFD